MSSFSQSWTSHWLSLPPQGFLRESAHTLLAFLGGQVLTGSQCVPPYRGRPLYSGVHSVGCTRKRKNSIVLRGELFILYSMVFYLFIKHVVNGVFLVYKTCCQYVPLPIFVSPWTLWVPSLFVTMPLHSLRCKGCGLNYRCNSLLELVAGMSKGLVVI